MRPPFATAARVLALLACVWGPAYGAQRQSAPGKSLEPPSQDHATGPEQNTAEGREGVASAREATGTERPLPDIPALMRRVEQNQRQSEAIQKTYLYRSLITQEEFDSHGQVKKRTTTEAEHLWLNGVPVARVVRRNGKDLTAEELAKEDERIEKETRKQRDRRDKIEAAGKDTDAQGHEEITVSRFLSLGSFSNARRVEINGRPTIAVDYTGDAHAKTRNRAEDAVRDMAGTVWVDEQDAVLTRVEGRFVNAFKIGGGLVADVKKDTRFQFQQTKVNGEVWLPSRIQAQGAMRALLFVSFSGQVEVIDSDYRKFRATATLLPDITPSAPAGDSGPQTIASPAH